MRNDSNPPRSAIDVEAELAYWRHALPGYDFHDGEPFSRYVKSFKFAYDAYVLHQGKPLDDLWVALEDRYTTRIPEEDRLPWQPMKHLLLAVWKKLNSPVPDSARPAGFRHLPEANGRASSPAGASTFQSGMGWTRTNASPDTATRR